MRLLESRLDSGARSIDEGFHFIRADFINSNFASNLFPSDLSHDGVASFSLNSARPVLFTFNKLPSTSYHEENISNTAPWSENTGDLVLIPAKTDDAVGADWACSAEVSRGGSSSDAAQADSIKDRHPCKASAKFCPKH